MSYFVSVARKKTRTEDQRRAQVRAAQARYRERHRDDLRAKRRERYWRDVTKSREQQRRSNKNQWRRNREKRREYNARYRAANRPRLLAKMKQWRLENLDRVRAHDRARSKLGYVSGEKLIRMKEWRRRNPDKSRAFLRASFHKRRMQVGDDSFTAAEWIALKMRHGGRCAYCGRDANLTVDHRIPLSRGGRNVIANIVPACKSCNSRKHDRTEYEYRSALRVKSAEQFTALFEALAHGPHSRDVAA